MNSLRLAGAALAAAAVLTVGTSGAFAHSTPHAKGKFTVEAGTITAYTAGTSVAINGTTYTLPAHTWLVPKDSAAKAAGVAVNDSVALLKWSGKNHSGAVLKYGTKPFVYLHRRFAGTYASGSAGSITIDLAKTKAADTFSVDSSTTYWVKGKKSTTAPAFTSGEKLVVLGEKSTNSSAWYAAIVAVGKRGPCVHGRHGHHHHRWLVKHHRH